MDDMAKRLESEARGVANTTHHFLTLAERYAEEGNVEAARVCLMLLCKNCDNYEESIEWNGLTEKWQQYRHLVEGLVPPSVKVNVFAPKTLAECTMQIGDIFLLPDDDVLDELFMHLGELSGQGDCLNRLNQWEQIAYLAYELCAEVNSGGFDRYLSYCGSRFEKAYTALKTIFAVEVLPILDAVRGKFHQNKMPKTEEGIQKAMDLLEETGVDFEREDERFYASGEKQLLTCLSTYVKENRQQFR